VDTRIALEQVLSLSARLSREAPFEGGAGELCGKLALLSAARGLALFAVDMAAAEAELLGAYGLAVEYVRRFPPRERRSLVQLPGDVRESLRRLEVVQVQNISDDPRTISLTSVARQGGLDLTVSVAHRAGAQRAGGPARVLCRNARRGPAGAAHPHHAAGGGRPGA
jgi:hypothetical protein